METSKPGDTTPASSFLAHTNGVYFAALVPLMEGANIIKVKGTDHSGVERSAIVTINASPTPDPVLLTYITPNAGLPVLKPDGSTSLDVVFQTVPNVEAPTGYLWDLNGEGTGELQCYSSPVTTGRFSTPGLYLPTVTMTDSQGRQYKDTTIVNVMNKDDMGPMFKMIWNRLKTNLLAGDIGAAMNDVVPEKREIYSAKFNQYGSSLSQRMFTGYIDLVFDHVNDVDAECGAIYEESEGTYYYPVLYYLDYSGTWKIRVF